jgi:hypothetical protein
VGEDARDGHDFLVGVFTCEEGVLFSRGERKRVNVTGHLVLPSDKIGALAHVGKY